jgi:hypothetical protein
MNFFFDDYTNKYNSQTFGKLFHTTKKVYKLTFEHYDFYSDEKVSKTVAWKIIRATIKYNS